MRPLRQMTCQEEMLIIILLYVGLKGFDILMSPIYSLPGIPWSGSRKVGTDVTSADCQWEGDALLTTQCALNRNRPHRNAHARYLTHLAVHELAAHAWVLVFVTLATAVVEF